MAKIHTPSGIVLNSTPTDLTAELREIYNIYIHNIPCRKPPSVMHHAALNMLQYYIIYTLTNAFLYAPTRTGLQVF